MRYTYGKQFFLEVLPMGLILLIILLIAAAVVLLYLWAIRPDTRRKQHCLSFSRWDFAHRGLWNMDRGIYYVCTAG